MAWPEEEGATRGEAQLRGSLPAALQGEGAARDKDPVDRTTQASLHARERVSTYNKLSRLCWFPLPRRTAPSRAQLPSRNRGCSGRLGVSPARGRRCHTVHSIGARPGRTGPCLTRGASHPALGRRSRGGGEREEPRFRCAGPIRRPAWMGAIKASGRVVKRGGGGVLFGRIQNATLTMGCSSSLRLSYGRSALYVISCLPEEDRARAFRSPSRRARLDNGRGARTRINSGPTWHMDPAPARARCVKRGVVFFGFSDGEGGLFTAVCVLEMSTRSRTSYEKMAEKFWKKRAVGAQPRRQNGTEPSRMRWKLRESRGARRATVASGLARPRYGTGQQLLYPGAGPRKAP